jgi:hypothetical protein
MSKPYRSLQELYVAIYEDVVGAETEGAADPTLSEMEPAMTPDAPGENSESLDRLGMIRWIRENLDKLENIHLQQLYHFIRNFRSNTPSAQLALSN